MKTTKLFTIIILCLMFVSFSVSAAEEKTDVKKELKNQTNCPVMGVKIDSTVYTDIQGQRVYHCCPMCSKKLKDDPDIFFKKAAEEGILFENIQATCPVSGEKLEEKTVYTDYEGRRIYFCCEKCPATFLENPKKYLEKIDSNPEKMKTSEKSGDNQSGHNQ